MQRRSLPEANGRNPHRPSGGKAGRKVELILGLFVALLAVMAVFLIVGKIVLAVAALVLFLLLLPAGLVAAAVVPLVVSPIGLLLLLLLVVSRLRR